MFQTSSSLLRLFLLIQIGLVAVSYAYPSSSSSSYVIVPASDQPVSVHKRAFDRLDGADFGFWSKRSVLKRAFDRLEGTEFGFRKKRAFDRVARIPEFGFRRKRSFDRITGSSFGLHKRAEQERDALVDELAASIIALRRAREEAEAEPLVLLEAVEN